MLKEEIVGQLRDLIHLDGDASHAYDQALQRIDHPGLREELAAFADEHRRHVAALADLMRAFGAEPPARDRDFRGFLLEGFTTLRSLTGVQGALEAMQSNEILTNNRYAEANRLDFPRDVRRVVERHFEDERRHLGRIKQLLDELSGVA